MLKKDPVPNNVTTLHAVHIIQLELELLCVIDTYKHVARFAHATLRKQVTTTDLSVT